MSIPFSHLDKLYINGLWETASEGTEAILNPATEEVIGHAPVGGLADAELSMVRHAAGGESSITL